VQQCFNVRRESLKSSNYKRAFYKHWEVLTQFIDASNAINCHISNIYNAQLVLIIICYTLRIIIMIYLFAYFCFSFQYTFELFQYLC